MRFLRKIYRRIISRNPETDTIDNLGANDEYHKLSDEDGCVESFHLEEKSNCDCGCFGLPAGRCSEPGCGRTSCAKCHHHCGGSENQLPAGCGKPICREHAHYLEVPGGTVAFCKRCHDRLVRKNRWLVVGQAFLLPFVDDKGEADGR